MEPVEVLQRHGPTLASLSIGGDTFPETMHARVLKRTQDRLILAFDDGENMFVLKQFDTTNPKGGRCYIRERDGLNLFAGTGLVPRMKCFNDRELFVIEEFVQGKSILDFISEANCVGLSKAIGLWLGAYKDVAPCMPVEGNWLDHLSGLNWGDTRKLEAFDGFLNGFALGRTILSRGDGALSNFLIDQKSNLFGIDFEKSQWQPVGWDFLLTARALVRKCPEKAQDCIEALAEGFADGKYEASKRWAALASVFVAAFLFDAVEQEDFLDARFLDAIADMEREYGRGL